MKIEFSVSKIEASQDGSPSVYIGFTGPSIFDIIFLDYV
jgi:hypothetical protein